MKNKGFTLIEMLVAMAIFSILLVSVMNTFTRGFYYQKRILEMQTVEREEAYLMEMVSREIRMATAINVSQAGKNGSSQLTFTDHIPASATYCLANCATSGSCTCSDTGNSFSVGGKMINSADVEITGLKFSTSQSFTDTQPLITVTMQVRSKKDTGVSAVLQTSVAMRLYPTI